MTTNHNQQPYLLVVWRVVEEGEHFIPVLNYGEYYISRHDYFEDLKQVFEEVLKEHWEAVGIAVFQGQKKVVDIGDTGDRPRR